jgi:hypothetical protein
MKPDPLAEPSAALALPSLLARDDWPLRLLRKVGLAPSQGLGLGRRAVFFSLLAWLPLAAWAFFEGRAMPGDAAEPLLAHYGITVRCLLAIPLLILAEGTALKTLVAIADHFIRDGLVAESQHAAFAAVLRGYARLRDSSLPWIGALALVVAWVIVEPAQPDADHLSWALDGTGRLGFGAWWFAYVARPLFLALLLGWLWRIALVFVLLWRIARLDLSLVPTHPDRAGGLGFLETLPKSYTLVTFAVFAVVASGWAHDAVYHGLLVQSLVPTLAIFAVLWILLLLLPLFAFWPVLASAKRAAKADYGRLVGEQGRLVHQRYVLDQPVAREHLLEPPGIGPVADAAALYQAVTRMRSAPIGKSAILAIVVPLIIPMLVVFALQIPLKTLLTKVLKFLV